MKIQVDPSNEGTFTLKLRIPGWARGEVVPSDLYSFLEEATEQAQVRVNGQPVALDLEKGYVSLTRHWRRSDDIALYLPMPIRRVVAHELVEADRARVALQRGPIVYCIEGADHEVGRVLDLALADTTALNSRTRPTCWAISSLSKGRQCAGRKMRPAS